MAQLELVDEVIEDTDERTITTRCISLGVVGAIVPWNFPSLLATAKMCVYIHVESNNLGAADEDSEL
jgi:acyl-CoA reductase-like NAD-dependent aldehyde dehydrogenase